jgi:hypothetical protein
LSGGATAEPRWDEDEGEEGWEYDEVEGEESAPRPRTVDDAPELQRSLALGLLAMVPMILAYELALAKIGGAQHNTSELILFRLFAPLGAMADHARWICLAGASIASLVWCLRQQWELGPRLFRIALEGLMAAVLMGPILVGITMLIGEPSGALPLGRDPAAAPNLVAAGLVFGGGAYEEIVFRVGAYSALFVILKHSASFLGASRGLARWIGEGGGLLGQALLFAGFHLALFTAWLGEGGESFDATTFCYRVIAGVLLGLLFRLRGPGVSSWAHGSFNLALLLGAGPDVFL